MKDQMDDLMKLAESCVAAATPETLEPEKIQLADLTQHNIKLLEMVAKRDNKIAEQKGQIDFLRVDRDQWRSKYEHALAINVIKE
tara:strand:- start:105 stop:359 length:255 start_codon:yes stop_codon:yes gene_type:complete